MEDKNDRRFISALLFALGTFGVLIIACLVWVSIMRSDLPFTKERWLADKGASGILSRTDRDRMADDLIKDHLKKGMTKEQIIAILGKPKEEKGDEEYQYLQYHVGMGLIDGTYLLVSFDKKWKLIDAHVVEL